MITCRAAGQAAANSAPGCSPSFPERGLTRTTRPAPSGSAGARVRYLLSADSPTRSGHHRRVASAIPVPISIPAATSEGQWTPVCTREYATAAAIGATASPAAGDSIATAVANAAADAACPDGNDDDRG